eukprot:UN18500
MRRLCQGQLTLEDVMLSEKERQSKELKDTLIKYQSNLVTNILTYLYRMVYEILKNWLI